MCLKCRGDTRMRGPYGSAESAGMNRGQSIGSKRSGRRSTTNEGAAMGGPSGMRAKRNEKKVL